jgi:hypothetical protein
VMIVTANGTEKFPIITKAHSTYATLEKPFT